MALVSPAATGTGWIRLGHLSPDTPPVDVCVYSCGNSSARIGLPEPDRRHFALRDPQCR